MEFAPGSVIAGRFEVEASVRGGAMAVVFRALDRQTGKKVALKMLPPGHLEQEVERFLREAEALSALRHPGIVGHVAHGLSEGEPYLTMEWLEGEDLSKRLRRGLLAVGEVLALLAAAADALAVAHRAGVLHRDLKPSNLFLLGGDPGRPVLIDFGLARRAMGEDRVTATGILVGTPAYMAPEQAKGERELLPSVDIFSLGCVAFECLVGEPPFAGDHIHAVLAKLLFGGLPLDALPPDLAPGVVALISGMLERAPGKRIADAEALSARLAGLGGEAAGAAQPAPRARSAIASDERRVLSVVASRGRQAMPASASSETLRDEAPSLVGLLRRLGADIEFMLDGSLVAAVAHRGSPTEQASMAVRCALHVREHWPEADVAVATGVAAGEGASRRGDVFDQLFAALNGAGEGPRLPPGAVLIDETTARLSGDYFKISRQEGRLLASLSYDAIDEQQPLLGVPTACVGREQELASLEAALSGSVRSGEPAVVLVTGGAGAGKSRLRREFLRWALATFGEASVLHGRGEPVRAGAPYGVIAGALRGWSGIRQGEDPESQRKKLSARVGDHLPGARGREAAELLLEACGVAVEQPAATVERRNLQQKAQAVSSAFVELLGAMSRGRPVVLVLEDLQWGDALSVGLVERALRDLDEGALMVLALARPEVDQLFPRLWSGHLRQRLQLGPLSPRACNRLIQQVLGDALPKEEKRRIIEQSGGNALLLEELIRAASSGHGGALPGTVLAVLSARLSRVSPEGRKALRAASVFGATFWEGGVRELLGPAEPVGALLEGLCEEELIERKTTSRFEGEEEYEFHHELIRDAAYALLLDQDRTLGHRLAGRFLERAGERDALVLAGHARGEGDRRREIALLTEAARHSYERFDLDGALSRVEQALACGAEGGELGALLALRSAVHLQREEWPAAVEAGMAALDLFPSGSASWLRAIQPLFVVSGNLPDPAPVQRLLGLFMAVDPRSADPGEYLRAVSFPAIMLSLIGARAPVGSLIAAAAGIALPAPDPVAEGALPLSEAWARYMLDPLPWLALDRAREALALLEQGGELRMASVAMQLIGLAQAAVGDLAACEATLRDNLALARRLGEPFTLSAAYLYLALALSNIDERAGEAARLAQEMLDAERNGRPIVLGCCREILGKHRLASGDAAGAAEEARVAFGLLKVLPPYGVPAANALARALLRAGEAAEARAVADQALALAEGCGGLGAGEVEARQLAAEARLACGDREAAAVALERGLDGLEARARGAPDPAALARFLALPAHARLLDLARAHPLDLDRWPSLTAPRPAGETS